MVVELLDGLDLGQGREQADGAVGVAGDAEADLAGQAHALVDLFEGPAEDEVALLDDADRVTQL